MNEVEKSRAAEIKDLHGKFVESFKKTLEYGIRIGELLVQQKEDSRYGEFGNWIKQNLPFTQRTAQNYMKLHRERARLKSETVSHLTDAYRLLSEQKPVDELEFHEATNLIPNMLPDEFEGLKASIQERGLIVPIVTFQGKIIDGRMRYKACQELGIKPHFQEWDGNGSLVSYIISMNVCRTHLSPDQRAVAAMEYLSIMEAEAKERQKLSEGCGKKGSQKVEHLNNKGKSTD